MPGSTRTLFRSHADRLISGRQLRGKVRKVEFAFVGRRTGCEYRLHTRLYRFVGHAKITPNPSLNIERIFGVVQIDVLRIVVQRLHQPCQLVVGVPVS
ncbi:hypothetical protein WS88_07455 [Burkholderia cepacia]|nr:hypothetical protein WS88_07455 [Burkholderia cepacia]